MKQYEKKTIMPFVVLYKNVFDNIPEILDLIKSSNHTRVFEEWEPWYQLGQRTRLEFLSNDYLIDKLTDVEEKQLALQEHIYNTLMDVYENYIQDWVDPNMKERYINRNTSFHEDWKYVFGEFVTDWSGFKNVPENPGKDCWIQSTVEILKHDHTIGRDLELAIGYHLDAFNSKDAAGPKSIITGTIYLNDEYDGGEISFLNEFDKSIISYKPKAGDLIVFPSAKPFFHAAQKVYGADKYLIRNFLLWDHSGSDRYKEGLEKFGEEQWMLIQDYLREKEDLMGLYQKDVYLPGVSVYEREHGNGVPFFPKTVLEWKE